MARFIYSTLIGSLLVFSMAHATEEALCSQNSSNTSFYEELGVDRLIEFSVESGLSSGEDIKRISQLINSSKTILEIGAGYGRAAHFTRENMSSDAILYLVENTPIFVKTLQSTFTFPTSVINKDFRKVSTDDLSYGKPNLVLWMWSGFADFGYDEQDSAFKALKELMAPDGLLIIDLPSLTSNTNATSLETSSQGATGIIQLDSVPTAFQGFIPSLQRMQQLAQNSGFTLEKSEEYTTPIANRTRTQFFLRLN